MTESKYDEIGKDYALNRKSDPRIYRQIYSHLKDAERIINIGAGTGSYEPDDLSLVAVEPSAEMIRQRKSKAHPALQAAAESLPFPDHSFTHALTILSMHHWHDLDLAFSEINRVASERFIGISSDPESKPFWLTQDYFPEVYAMDQKIFPSRAELERYFDDVRISTLMIPEDCQDGFLAAYWKRPEAYLDPEIRKSISTFTKIQDYDAGLHKLRNDLNSGAWEENNQALLQSSALDVGYIIISAKTRST